MINLSAYEIAMIGVGGTLAGALLGVWLGYRLSLSLANLSVKRDAAAKFRAAFKDELLALNPTLSRNTVDTCTLLESAFDKHRSAVFDFKQYLKGAEKAQFEQAWQVYYRYEDAPDFTIPGFTQYSGVGCGLTEAKHRRLLAAQRIEKLLSFAEFK